MPTMLSQLVFNQAAQSCLHYKHLQFYPEGKCEFGMGKTYTQFYKKWSEVKNKLYWACSAIIFIFLQNEQKSFLFILANLGNFAEHAQFCSIFITEPFCWKKLTFCSTQTVVFSLGEITNFCSVLQLMPLWLLTHLVNLIHIKPLKLHGGGKKEWILGGHSVPRRSVFQF